MALSGRQSLKLTHQLRAGHDAILVGIGTVLSDDPRLNVRLVNGNNPRPVIVDSRLRIPLTSRLLNEGAQSPWIVTAQNPEAGRRRALESMGARVISLPSNKRGMVNLAAMLKTLAGLGIKSLMVEGGAKIITNFLTESIADYIVMTMAPVLVDGLHAVSDLGRTGTGDALLLSNRGHRWLGNDLIIWLELAHTSNG